MVAPLLVFVVTYILIAVQQVSVIRLNRPAASLCGAVAMVTIGGLPLREAYAAIDLDVMVFLLGVMILIGYLEQGGFFEWAAARVLERARTPRQLLVGVVVGSGLLSAFFVNDTICLVLTPVLLVALRALGAPPVPYLVALAMGANVGSALTFVGNPQNMLVGLWSGIPFGAFALHMLPVVAGALGITCAVLLFTYRRELGPAFASSTAETRALATAHGPPLDRRLVGKALVLFGGAVVAWFAGLSLPLVAIAAGAVMIAVASRDPAPALARVDWTLLLFFGALFVVMRGLEWSGAVGALNAAGTHAAQLGGRWTGAGVVSGTMLVLSNLISNVPAAILWRHVLPTLPDAALLWKVMAMSATFAGNFLLIGSMANLIVVERAEARGVRVSFREYARAGIPVALLTILWGVTVLVLAEPAR